MVIISFVYVCLMIVVVSVATWVRVYLVSKIGGRGGGVGYVYIFFILL